MEEKEILIVDDVQQIKQELLDVINVQSQNDTPKVNVIDQKQLDEEEAKLHPGKVKLRSGEWVERSEVVFRLEQNSVNPQLFRTMDGTIYRKQKSGAMVKIKEKTKAERKEEKRKRREHWKKVREQNRFKAIRENVMTIQKEDAETVAQD